MKVLMNLATCKKGGGQNVALNFLDSLDRVDTTGFEFCYSVVENSAIHKFLKNKNVPDIILMPSNPLRRMVRELLRGNKIIRKHNVDIIYTYFGTGLYPKSIPQISGSADSNIYFPEINFWSDYSGLKRLLFDITDKYRIWGVKRMSAIVFENHIMEKRSKQLFNLSNTIFIKPSINAQYANQTYNLPIDVNTPKGLFLCGWHRNKNFIIIPKLAHLLKQKSIDFHFIITAEKDNSADHLAFEKEIEKYGVQDMVSIVGSVKKEELASLYGQIDFVFLLSKLESFSNNIIEAWHFKKPLIVSDELWARSICKDAAVYVDRDNPEEIVDAIISLISNKISKETVALCGQNEILTYPSIEERTKQELQYLTTIHESI